MTDIVPTLHEEMMGPPTEGNPRNSEGDIIPLQDGRLLFAWSRFTHGGQDHSPGEIYAAISQDDGYTWNKPFLLQENIGKMNVMSVSFLRLHSGDILFGFLVKGSVSLDCHLYVRRSSDEGRSWSAPVLATPEDGYFVVNNDRLVQTRSGRLIVPVAKWTATVDEYVWDPFIGSCFASDDEGQTWRRCTNYSCLSGAAGLQEPGVIECADGSLWMYIRTDKGYIYESRSSDDGESWSLPEPTDLVAPLSPSSAKRLPGSDDILMIYNDRSHVPFKPNRDYGGVLEHNQEYSRLFNWRTPLSSAVSSDGGRTWHHHKTVETDETLGYAYTSITFHKDLTLLSYHLEYPGRREPLERGLKLKVVPTAAWTE